MIAVGTDADGGADHQVLVKIPMTALDKEGAFNLHNDYQNENTKSTATLNDRDHVAHQTVADTFPIGDTTINFTAADEDGNITTQAITLHIYADTRPVVTACDLERISDEGRFTINLVARDNSGTAPTLLHADLDGINLLATWSDLSGKSLTLIHKEDLATARITAESYDHLVIQTPGFGVLPASFADESGNVTATQSSQSFPNLEQAAL